MLRIIHLSEMQTKVGILYLLGYTQLLASTTSSSCGAHGQSPLD